MITEQPGDLTLDEMRSVIASIFRIDATRVEDWLIVVKKPCDKCGRQFCGDGDLATVSSRTATLPDGSPYSEPAFDLHLVAKLIDAFAVQWSERNS